MEQWHRLLISAKNNTFISVASSLIYLMDSISLIWTVLTFLLQPTFSLVSSNTFRKGQFPSLYAEDYQFHCFSKLKIKAQFFSLTRMRSSWTPFMESIWTLAICQCDQSLRALQMCTSSWMMTQVWRAQPGGSLALLLVASYPFRVTSGQYDSPVGKDALSAPCRSLSSNRPKPVA